MPSKSPVVVVTGSSKGIGLDICLALLRRNYTVIATLRTPSEAPEILRVPGCYIHGLDVTNADSASALVSYLQAEHGGCDVLVNNAGYGVPGTLETIDLDHAKEVFEVNVWGAARMVKEIVPLMRERGGGLLLTVSSTSGYRGLPCSDIYTGSKFAIEGIMESFRYSVLKDNIKVCMVNPGPTATQFAARIESEHERTKTSEGQDLRPQRRLTEEYVKIVGDRNAAGQKSDECAEVIVDVIDRELPKRIDDGSSRARFTNPTSEYTEKMINQMRTFPDGCTGPQYDPLYKHVLEVLNREEEPSGV